MSALFDREHPPRRHGDDDTAENLIPTTVEPHQPDGTRPSGYQESPPQSLSRSPRIKTTLLLGVYTPATLGSAWLAILAFLRLNAIVMVLMTVAAVWLGLEAVGLARWLLGHARQQPRPSRVQRLVACVLAVTYAFLLLDWLLHQ